MTCSGSPLRSRPWLTCTHTRFLPMARMSSAATTDESTPPDSASSTFLSPTCARIAATCSSMKASASACVVMRSISSGRLLFCISILLRRNLGRRPVTHTAVPPFNFASIIEENAAQCKIFRSLPARLTRNLTQNGREVRKTYCSICRPMKPAAVSVTLISVWPMFAPGSRESRITAPTGSPSTSIGVTTCAV